MPRPPRFRVGLALALLVLLALRSPSAAVAQDGDAAPTEATQAADDGAPTPPPDAEPPVLDGHADVVAAAADASGAVVDYAVPGASDDTDGPVVVDCSPAPGALFPLGATVVACSAGDAAGNRGQASFTVTVTDQTPPVVAAAADVAVVAADASGAAVGFAVPGASDDVDGAVIVTCDWAPGAVFPVGTTVVTCAAQDLAGNAADPVSFAVTVDAPPAPTDEPAATATPDPTETAVPTGEATDAPTDEPGASATPAPPDEATTEPTTEPTNEPTTEPTDAATATPTPTADGEGSDPAPGPTPAALPVDDALVGSFAIVTDGGPLGVLASIWGGLDFPISQEFGHTDFSVAHHAWYAYGADYGLDGYEHPGIDVGMPRGTALYAPIDGTVAIAGGVPYYTFYGNGDPGVGELLIRAADGDQVILGHLGRIAVEAGQEVRAGQFVGLSGGDNGDHLHLEARERQPLGGYRIVDPRQSFLVPVLEAALAKASGANADAANTADAGTSTDLHATTSTADASAGATGGESLSQPAGRLGAVADQRSDKYAKITIVRVNCAVNADGSGIAACGNDVLAGSEFTVSNPTHHGRTRVTGPTGETAFGPRAGDNVVTKAEDPGAFAGAYVACIDQDSGRVLFRGAIAEPSVALDTQAGERIACDWYDLAAGTPAGPG